MESFLLQLNNHTDLTTKQMLQNLIDKKIKYNRYKQTHFIFLTVATLFGFFIFYYIYKTAIEPYSYSLLDILSVLTSGRYLFLIFIAFTLFGGVKIFYDKKEKLEKEYHALRCEIIEKSKDLWKGESWKQRHKVFEQMKSKYDINLYHESK